jgi:hypothetical protein
VLHKKPRPTYLVGTTSKFNTKTQVYFTIMLIRTLTWTVSSAVLLSTLVNSAFASPIYSANTVSNIKANTRVIAQNGVQIKRNLLRRQLPIAKEVWWFSLGGAAWIKFC